MIRNINNYFRIGVLALLSTAAISCHSQLDVSPEGLLTTEDIFDDPVLTGAYINTCYQGIPPYGNTYYFDTNLPVLLSDDAWEYGTSSRVYLAYDGMSVDNNWLIRDNGNYMWGYKGNDSWAYFYTYINNCNIFLDNIPTAAVTETNRAAYQAEVKVLRAYMYYELFSRFGDVPLLTTASAIGDLGEDLYRTDLHEVVDFIISECEEALEVSEFVWRYTEDGVSRMNKAVAAALISRSALYAVSPLFADDSYCNEDGQAHNWAWAMTKCKESLDICLANGYELYNTSNTYTSTGSEIFTGNKYYAYCVSTQDFSTSPIDKESIMVASDQLYNTNKVGYPSLSSTKSGWTPTQELVDSYPMADGQYVVDPLTPYNDDQHLDPNYVSNSGYDPTNPYAGRDPRFYATIIYNEAPASDVNGDYMTMYTYSNSGSDEIYMGDTKKTCTGYYVRKYIHPLSTGASPQTTRPHMRMMKLSELYLNYAECAVECDNFSEAEAAILPIRNRVEMPNIELVGKDQDMARAMVANERRIEMALEEGRYNDIRRWTSAGENMKLARYLTAMWIEKSSDGSYSYNRVPVGQSWDEATQQRTGNAWTRESYKAQYLLHGLQKDEVIRLNQLTGLSWQNPGW